MRDAALAAMAAAGLCAASAEASNLDLGELSAALAFPIITGAHPGNALKGSAGDGIVTRQSAVTLATVTNGKSTPVRLKLELISGDPSTSGGDNWQSTSFECDLTGRETTSFVFMPRDGLDQGDPGDGRSRLYVECSNLATQHPEGSPRALFTNVQNGVLFVAVADPASGDLVSEDVIFGDAVVVDFTQGQAYSFDAISFQAGQGQNDGDKIYRFDNGEYARFPSVLATNFLAPRDGAVSAELLLITLDGTTGNVPVPRVRLGGLAYNDDEQYFDFQWEFDCFDVVALTDLDPNFLFVPGGVLGLGSLSGHLQVVPQPVATANDVHDAAYGDANNVRRRPAHGWLVQSVTGTLVPPNEPIPGTPGITVQNGPAAWGRPLSQSTTALLPFLGDQSPVLDADPVN
jgi:hypothetical protein